MHAAKSNVKQVVALPDGELRNAVASSSLSKLSGTSGLLLENTGRDLPSLFLWACPLEFGKSLFCFLEPTSNCFISVDKRVPKQE